MLDQQVSDTWERGIPLQAHGPVHLTARARAVRASVAKSPLPAPR